MKFDYKFKKNDMVVNTETTRVGTIIKRIGSYNEPCYLVQYDTLTPPCLEKEKNLHLVACSLENSTANQVEKNSLEERKETLRCHFDHIKKRDLKMSF